MNLGKTRLIIIGGAEDKKNSKVILKEISDIILSKNGNLVIAPTASQIPDEIENIYLNVFKELGIEKIRVLNIKDRSDAYKEENIEMIRNADLVFFTGGDQLRITSVLGGTPIYKELDERFDAGCIFAGTSAGASVMSEVMISHGDGKNAPRKKGIGLAPGLGFIENCIIDQHFEERGRIGRLMTSIAQNPQKLGIGIDEDTAIIVNDQNKFRVIGSGAVYVLDGANCTENKISSQSVEEVIAIFGVQLHLLNNKCVFDITNRKPELA